MTNYQFTAPLVTANKSKAITVCIIGVVIAFISIPAFIVSLNPALIAVFFLGGIGTATVGAIMAKGNVSVYKIEQDQFFIFTERYLQIGLVVYPLNEVSALNIYFHSYNNQSPGGYYTEHSGEVMYGIGNTVSFTYKDMKIFVEFFVSNKQQADAFFEMMEFFKREGIKFGLEIRRPYT